MAKFDLSKTQEVQDLFQVAREQRDDAWRERFYAAIVDASMAAPPEQILRGPDGFSYFVLNLPPVGQPFETFCISHVLDVCLDNGFGVAIQPDANPPEWVFPYGTLWSLKELGRFQMAPAWQPDAEKTSGSPAGESAPAGGGPKVLSGQPSPGFFPAYARKAIKRFLTEKTGNTGPRVLLVTDPCGVPVQSLVFSVFPEDFPDRKDFEDVMYRLTWFLPGHYGLLSIVKDSDLAKQFEPL
jgi:hypothetical protein